MQEEIEKAKSAALRLLSYRIRTCREISDKLQAKGFSPNIIKKVVKDLKRINYLNDYEFAKVFVESRTKHNPKGKKILRYELLRKGIDNKIAEEVINKEMPAEKEENTARLLAEKIWQRKKNIETAKRKAQTYNYLTRRGFSASVIIRILEELKN